MIGYAPLEEMGPPPTPQPSPKPIVQRKAPLSNEDTECNYLVMFFIVGVFVLAATDSIGKP